MRDMRHRAARYRRTDNSSSHQRNQRQSGTADRQFDDALEIDRHKDRQTDERPHGKTGRKRSCPYDLIVQNTDRDQRLAGHLCVNEKGRPERNRQSNQCKNLPGEPRVMHAAPAQREQQTC